MRTADVKFSRRDGGVLMTLSAGGGVIAESTSEESIARELQIRGMRFMAVDGLLTVELPTTKKALALAMEVPFPEQMPALKLIAACAAWGETPAYPFPERRQRPRPTPLDAGGTDPA